MLLSFISVEKIRQDLFQFGLRSAFLFLSQLTAAILSGPTGLLVVSLVTKELRLAFVPVPIPHLQIVDATVADWDELRKCEHVP